jgi:hypothetical protein
MCDQSPFEAARVWACRSDNADRFAHINWPIANARQRNALPAGRYRPPMCQGCWGRAMALRPSMSLWALSMRRLALGCLLSLSMAMILSGCASVREAWSSWHLGADGTRQSLDTLYAEGARALADNRIEVALGAWRQYAQAAPSQLPQAGRVRGYITLLEREAARRYARRVAAGERTVRAGPADRLHLALFPFQSQGPNAARDPLHRALLAMVTIDLSKVPAITVLEREHIDALLREHRLADSGLVDHGTLLAQAQLLGAGTVVGGLVFNAPGTAGPGSGRYKINTAVTRVADGQVVGTQEADGRQAEFFRLEKEIVLGILRSLDITDIPPAVNQVHTRSWEAYARFAAGLAALAEDRFDDARAAFRAALTFDPGFALAEQAFAGVPEQGTTLDSIRAELGAAGR